MKTALLIAIAGSLIVANAYADDMSSGCGLGWQVTNRMSLVSSSIRGTTNVIASNTIGMTSGTSGCDQHSIVKTEKKGIHYVEANFENLMVEMAQGKGEYLEIFAILMGCTSGEVQEFSALARDRYSKIFTSDSITPVKMLKNLKEQMSTSPHLVSGCDVSV